MDVVSVLSNALTRIYASWNVLPFLPLLIHFIHSISCQSTSFSLIKAPILAFLGYASLGKSSYLEGLLYAFVPRMGLFRIGKVLGMSAFLCLTYSSCSTMA
jgi:hypothetical protein